MEDILKEWIDDINQYLNEGYKVEDLKDKDKLSLFDYLLGVENTLAGFNQIYSKDSVIDKIIEEISDDIEVRCRTNAIAGACDLIYSIMDNDEDYYEKDSVQ